MGNTLYKTPGTSNLDLKDSELTNFIKNIFLNDKTLRKRVCCTGNPSQYIRLPVIDKLRNLNDTVVKIDFSDVVKEDNFCSIKNDSDVSLNYGYNGSVNNEVSNFTNREKGGFDKDKWAHNDTSNCKAFYDDDREGGFCRDVYDIDGYLSSFRSGTGKYSQNPDYDKTRDIVNFNNYQDCNCINSIFNVEHHQHSETLSDNLKQFLDPYSYDMLCRSQYSYAYANQDMKDAKIGCLNVADYTRLNLSEGSNLTNLQKCQSDSDSDPSPPPQDPSPPPQDPSPPPSPPQSQDPSPPPSQDSSPPQSPQQPLSITELLNNHPEYMAIPIVILLLILFIIYELI